MTPASMVPLVSSGWTSSSKVCSSRGSLASSSAEDRLRPDQLFASALTLCQLERAARPPRVHRVSLWSLVGRSAGPQTTLGALSKAVYDYSEGVAESMKFCACSGLGIQGYTDTDEHDADGHGRAA